MGTPLSDLDVLVIDCQATAAAPRGRLLEIGWARAGTLVPIPQTCLIAMPDGERIPPAVARITGITDGAVRGGVDAGVAWHALSAAAAALTPQPAPTVIHFARFEQPFLSRLAGGVPPLDIMCTHAIAARLLPDLPRRSLRALAGYFGHAVGPLRRSGDHVEATALVWRELVKLLDAQGVSSWSALKEWLAAPVGKAPFGKAQALPYRRSATGVLPFRRAASRRWIWPMPASVRLALPDAPGVYRMLRSSGDVLYVGKAASLHHRVNSYFRHQRGIPERMLEMLSQARGVSFELTPSALEAALVEPDEIKRLRPPYNIALTEADRDIWFAARDLLACSREPSARCRVGPFPSAETLDQFAALADGKRTALGQARWAPDNATFHEGCVRFRAAHHELSLDHLAMSSRLLRLGTRLWREGRRDRDGDADDGPAGDHRVAAWMPESVQLSLEWLVLRAALARRRAVWFTRMTDASVAWREPDGAGLRLLLIENGDLSFCGSFDPGAALPIPPGHRREMAARHRAFTLARFDRLRVLTTELKRLVAAGAPVAVRFGVWSPLTGARLASLLGWL